jgi:NADH/F420H2 dehydrogenase subunit C
MRLNALSGDRLAERLEQALPNSVLDRGRDEVWVEPGRMAEVARFLKEDEALDFQYLNSVSAVDFIEFFAVVYHLTSLSKRHTALVKARVYGRDDLVLPSVYHIWRGADFQEREIWDLMGIRFAGHPNMKRIMLWEGFEGHPLRKDFL